MKMLLFNIIALFFLGTNINAQTVCPRNWWPLNPNYKLGTIDVMGSSNIILQSGSANANDRITGTENSNAVFLLAPTAVVDPRFGLNGYQNFLVLPADTYFATSVFTITFWIYLPNAIGAGGVTRVLDFSQTSYVFPFAAATAARNGISIGFPASSSQPQIEVRTTAAVAPNTIGTTTGAVALNTWTFVSFSCTVTTTTTTCTSFTGTSAGGLVTATAGAAINVVPSTGSYVYNYIGASSLVLATDNSLQARINDVKIYSSALSEAQLRDNFNAEKSTRAYTCSPSSSSSINAQYFYIVVLAAIGSFL